GACFNKNVYKIINISRCYVGKLKIRQYGIGSLIAIAAIGTAATLYFESPQPKVAQVLSSEPIRITVPAPHHYCHETVFAIPIRSEDMKGGLFTGYEYRILTLLDNIKASREYLALNHSALKNCLMVYVKEQRTVGYDVNYTIGDNPGKVRVTYKPEQTIPLNEKGQLILQPYL
ncbi:UmoD family protein, partial [Xenorhabdus sp. XENO-7]